MFCHSSHDIKSVFRGVDKSDRQSQIDAYAAVVCNTFLVKCYKLYEFAHPCACIQEGSTVEYNWRYVFFIFWMQMVLERYFSMSGEGTELVLPRNLDLQDKLQRGPPKDTDFFDEDYED